jgi:hypothetical protein
MGLYIINVCTVGVHLSGTEQIQLPAIVLYVTEPLFKQSLSS